MVNASSTNSRHIPVMLMESLENLKIKHPDAIIKSQKSKK